MSFERMLLVQQARLQLESVQEQNNYQRIVYQGGCMSPSLKINDLLFVREVDPARLRFGDMIVYNEGTDKIVHRFLFRRQKRQELVTKPDRSWRASPPFKEQHLVGVVEYIRRNKKNIRVNATITRPKGVYALIQ